MDAFYEKDREENESLHCRRGGDYGYPPHFHGNIEIFVCFDGFQSVVYDGTSYELRAGDVFFCDSYAPHTYQTTPQKKKGDLLIVFPAHCAFRFNDRNKGMKPRVPVVHDPLLCEQLSQISVLYFEQEQSDVVRDAACELFLALIETRLEFVESKERNETQLIRDLLTYLSAHFKEDISLKQIAKTFGYADAHVSRVFHRYTNTGIPRYVNRLRLNDVEWQRKTKPTASLSQIVFDAGFKSLPTYYRVKEQSEKNQFATRMK